MPIALHIDFESAYARNLPQNALPPPTTDVLAWVAFDGARVPVVTRSAAGRLRPLVIRSISLDMSAYAPSKSLWDMPSNLRSADRNVREVLSSIQRSTSCAALIIERTENSKEARSGTPQTCDRPRFGNTSIFKEARIGWEFAPQDVWRGQTLS
jgi:hypothetical protein